MFYKVISKINARLKFIHQKSKYLTPNLCHLLCNSLIQPHVCFALHSTLIIPKNWKTNFKFHKINVFVPVYSWVKCYIYLKKNYNQLVGCPLKKNIISVQIPLPSDTLITNAPIIWMKFLWKHQNLAKSTLISIKCFFYIRYIFFQLFFLTFTQQISKSTN